MAKLCKWNGLSLQLRSMLIQARCFQESTAFICCVDGISPLLLLFIIDLCIYWCFTHLAHSKTAEFHLLILPLHFCFLYFPRWKLHKGLCWRKWTCTVSVHFLYAGWVTTSKSGCILYYFFVQRGFIGVWGYYNCCVTLYYCTIEDKHHNKLFLKDGYFMYNWSVTVSFVPTVFQQVLKS